MQTSICPFAFHFFTYFPTTPCCHRRPECWGADTGTASRARGSGRTTAEVAAGAGMLVNKRFPGSSQMSSRPQSGTSGTPARAVSTGRLRSTTAGISAKSRGDRHHRFVTHLTA